MRVVSFDQPIIEIANMNWKRCAAISLGLVLFFEQQLCAAVIDTVVVWSRSMHKETQCVVIRPDVAQQGPLPVLYLLHGLGGDHQSWLTIKPELPQWSDELQMIIVCPNGGERSWYLDSPIDSSFRYETYMIEELVPFIDTRYSTIASRDGRAIAGLSMGGHGSLFLAIRHPNIFGAASSTSGSVDLLKRTFSWKYKEMILGDIECCLENWKRNSVIEMVDQLKPHQLFISIDCGTQDDLYLANKALHEKLIAMQIEHVYAEGPGKHDAAYWSSSIVPILRFTKQYFDRK